MSGHAQHSDAHCSACGDVIGVYEPMLVVMEEELFVTSRAAARDSLPPGARRYHLSCSALPGGETPPPQP